MSLHTGTVRLNGTYPAVLRIVDTRKAVARERLPGDRSPGRVVRGETRGRDSAGRTCWRPSWPVS
jgi:hypothetical protein